MDAGRSFADLHCHSAASFDSLSPPRALVRAAVSRGLTHLAITDHERLDGALAARDLAGDDLTVIIGEEIRTTAGDLIGLFLERTVPPGMTPAETAAAVREQGGIVGLPHPFDRFRASGARLAGAGLEELLGAVDYVEAYNGRIMVGAGNRLAAELARSRSLPGVAVSDAHTIVEVGVSYTILPGDIGSADDLRAALPASHMVMGRASRFVRAVTPAATIVNRLRGNRPRRTPAAAPSRTP